MEFHNHIQKREELEALLREHEGWFFIAGPTASGKTDLSLKMARFLGGEIVSADSTQVYKEMDIGTDKVSAELRAELPHHMLDLVSPTHRFSLHEYMEALPNLVQGIEARHKRVIFCGGTHLYVRAITQGYALPNVKPDLALRARLEEQAIKEGVEAVHAQLAKLAPEKAQSIHANNLRYVIRAIEVAMQAPEAFDKKGESGPKAILLGVDWPREVLYERINQRAQKLLDRGLLDELQALYQKYPDWSLPAFQALGYKEFLPYLKGEGRLEDALELLQKNTRHFAKRQLTWMRKEHSMVWIHPDLFMQWAYA